MFRLVIHRGAKAARELREAFLVGFDAIDESIEAQPLACEVTGKRLRLFAGDHADHLGAEDPGVAKFASLGDSEECAVGDRGPEEIGQAGGEFEVVEGPLGFAGHVMLDAKEEAGMKEEGREWHPHGLLELLAFGGGFGDRREEGSKVFFSERSTVGERTVVGEDLARSILDRHLAFRLGEEESLAKGVVLVEGVDDPSVGPGAVAALPPRAGTEEKTALYFHAQHP